MHSFSGQSFLVHLAEAISLSHVLLLTCAVDTVYYAIFAHRIPSSVTVALCGIRSETLLRSGRSGVRIAIGPKRPDLHYADVTAHVNGTTFVKNKILYSSPVVYCMRAVVRSQACWYGSSEIAEVLIAWYVVRLGEASYSESLLEVGQWKDRVTEVQR